MGKKILIICYSFPPFPGIGGRRWAKFAKYLKRNGHEVYIIACKNPFEEKSQWINDINGLDITYLPLRYPKALMLLKPRHIWDRALYHLSMLGIKIVSRGNHFDRTLFWKNPLLKTATRLIEEHGINNIIVSGAPFRHMFYAIELKNKFPKINFIADFRDLWFNKGVCYGVENLSLSRWRFEKKMELIVVNSYNYIYTVADDLTDYFKNLCQNQTTQIFTIKNGFDREDYKNIPKGIIPNNNKIRFIFTGTFYNNLESVFKPFLDSLINLKKKYPNIYNSFQFDFYGRVSENFTLLLRENDIEIVSYHGFLPLSKVYEEIARSHICMLFLMDNLTFSFSTKFYEYVSLRKIIGVFSQKGKTGEYVVRNKIGYQLTPENMQDELLKIHKDFIIGNLKFNDKFVTDQFDVTLITEEISGILI